MNTKIYYRFGSLVLLGMGLVLVTHLVRPTLTGAQPWVFFIFGVLPNFGAGLGIPFGIMLVMSRVLEFRKVAMKEVTLFLICAAISLAGICAWEFTGGTIDAWDLVATSVGVGGALCAYFFCIDPT